MITREKSISLEKWSTLLACWPIPEAYAKAPKRMVKVGSSLQMTFEASEQALKLASYSNKIIPFSLTAQDKTLTLLMDESLEEILDIQEEDSKQEAVDEFHDSLDEFDVLDEIEELSETKSDNGEEKNDFSNLLPSPSSSIKLMKAPTLSGQGPYSQLDILRIVMPYLSKEDLQACFILQGELKRAVQLHARSVSLQRSYGFFLPTAIESIANSEEGGRLNESDLFIEGKIQDAELAFYICETMEKPSYKIMYRPGLVCVPIFKEQGLVKHLLFYYFENDTFNFLCKINGYTTFDNNPNLRDFLLNLVKKNSKNLPVAVPIARVQASYLDQLFTYFPEDSYFKRLISLKRKLLNNIFDLPSIVKLNLEQLKGILDFNWSIENVSHPYYFYDRATYITDTKRTNIKELLRLSSAQWDAVLKYGFAPARVNVPHFSRQTLRAVIEQGVQIEDATVYDLSAFQDTKVKYAELILDFSVEEALMRVSKLEEKNNRLEFFDIFFTKGLFDRMTRLAHSKDVVLSLSKSSQLQDIHNRVQTAFFDEVKKMGLHASYPGTLKHYEKSMAMLLNLNIIKIDVDDEKKSFFCP